MPTELHLTGLVANHPASALATIGLYSVLPGCRIRHQRKGGSYYTVLESDIASVADLAKILSDKKTWENLNMPIISKAHIATQIPTVESKKDKKKTKKDEQKAKGLLFQRAKLTLEHYEIFKKIDPEFAAGLGCELKLEKDKPDKKKPDKILEITVAPGVWYFSLRNESLATKLSETVNLASKDKNTEKNLVNDRWIKTVGNNYGFFPSDATSNVYRNFNVKEKKSATKSQIQTVPFLCLTALAAFRLLPCYMNGRKVVSHGWQKDGFYFPMVSRLMTKEEYIGWLMNSDLQQYEANRTAWAKIGIQAVYQMKTVRKKETAHCFSPTLV